MSSNAMSIEDYDKQVENLKEKRQSFNPWGEIVVNSPLNGFQPLFALLGYDDLRNLEGKLLTLMDAAFTDTSQRSAVKSLVRQSIWWHWVPNLDTNPDVHSGGMPVE